MQLIIFSEDGCVYIGDVAFANREALQKCKDLAGEAWDDDELYIVYDEPKTHFPDLKFERISDCAGLLALQK